MKWRERESAPLASEALKTTESSPSYYFLPPLQVEREWRGAGKNGEVKKRSRDPFHQQDERCCVCWGVVVTNRSLGGFDGRSALSGRLWCYHCADGFPPLLLPLGVVR